MIRPNGYYWVSTDMDPEYFILEWDDLAEDWFNGYEIFQNPTIKVISGPIAYPDPPTADSPNFG